MPPVTITTGSTPAVIVVVASRGVPVPGIASMPVIGTRYRWRKLSPVTVAPATAVPLVGVVIGRRMTVAPVTVARAVTLPRRSRVYVTVTSAVVREAMAAARLSVAWSAPRAVAVAAAVPAFVYVTLRYWPVAVVTVVPVAARARCVAFGPSVRAAAAAVPVLALSRAPGAAVRVPAVIVAVSVA
jgi:hypothetical protein